MSAPRDVQAAIAKVREAVMTRNASGQALAQRLVERARRGYSLTQAQRDFIAANTPRQQPGEDA